MLHFHQQNCKNRVSFRFKFQNIILSSMLPNSPHTALQAATILVNMASKKIWRLNFQLKSPIWWPEFDSHERRCTKFLYLLVLMVSPKLNWDKHRAVVKGRGTGISPGYYEHGPPPLSKENKRKIEPKETPSCLIPRLLVVFTRQLEILVTTL